MDGQEERRADYIHLGDKLGELGKELAISNANLANIIKLFDKHLTDDKDTVKRVDDLSTSVSNIKGRIWGACTASGAVGAAAGSVIGIIIGIFEIMKG